MLFVNVLAIAALYGLVFLVLEVIAVKVKPPIEVSRKVAHMIAGVGAALLPLFISYFEIALVAMLFVVGMYVSLKRGFFPSVHNVARRTRGEIYFPVGILLCALFFQGENNLIYMYSILTVAISDALASLVGQRFGKKHFSLLGSHKSRAGSLAFFVSCAALGLGLILNLTPTAPVTAAVVSLFAAAVLTAVEAASSNGLDNLTVPMAAGATLLLFGGAISL